MASVELTVEMIDKVSAPAKKAAASVDKINKATGRLRDAKGRFIKLDKAVLNTRKSFLSTMIASDLIDYLPGRLIKSCLQ